MMKELRGSKGFTLIELLIVIAVLAILVSFAVLYYGSTTTASAYRVALLGDLRQIDTAIAMCESNNGTLPLGVEVDSNTVTTGNTDIPLLLRTASWAQVSPVIANDANLREILRRTVYLLKGVETGDIRGAGKLYYVNSVVDPAPTSATAVSRTAQAGGAATITLAAGASATDDLYNNLKITIESGTGIGQTRTISDYVGATKVATVSVAWTVQPDATSVYTIPNPLRANGLLFVPTATTTNLKILDANGTLIYSY